MIRKIQETIEPVAVCFGQRADACIEREDMMLFIMDWILEAARSLCEDISIDLLPGDKLSDLEYADDIVLLSEDPGYYKSVLLKRRTRLVFFLLTMGNSDFLNRFSPLSHMRNLISNGPVLSGSVLTAPEQTNAGCAATAQPGSNANPLFDSSDLASADVSRSMLFSSLR
ncbi:unnamed protein product [Echinostoma caproni]|uniref:Reverse transcriptase domain-containing protein n=1 Tax=Echinostoma caproni TaxID=27848 RepID=A0A183BBD9_9TREM|nr:unnamed protein product [Echinostoma caproni]